MTRPLLPNATFDPMQQLIERLLHDDNRFKRWFGLAFVGAAWWLAWKCITGTSIQDSSDLVIAAIAIGALGLAGGLFLRSGLRSTRHHPLVEAIHKWPERIRDVSIEYTPRGDAHHARVVIRLNESDLVILSPPSGQEQQLAQWIRAHAARA